jgi:hypothetical protein
MDGGEPYQGGAMSQIIQEVVVGHKDHAEVEVATEQTILDLEVAVVVEQMARIWWWRRPFVGS